MKTKLKPDSRKISAKRAVAKDSEQIKLLQV
jgi:hypothetical protein